MADRFVGSTQLKVGSLGLGVAPLGNLFTEVSDADADGTLTAAEDKGISWFDAAPYYGFGLAEERLGRHLGREPKRQRIISTKVGRVLERVDKPPPHEHFVAVSPVRAAFDYSRSGIERSFEDSLNRLGLSRVQILLLHDVDRLHHPIGHRSTVKQLFEEALPTLYRLKAEGRVDAIGVGVGEWDIAYELLASAELDCVLLAGRHTLMDQSAFSSGFLDTCARKGVSVLAAGVFNSGFLAGGPMFDYRTASATTTQRRSELAAVCDRHGVELAAAALQFAAAHPAIISVAVGARTAQEIEEIMGWSSVNIPAQLWSDLIESGLIPKECPIPCV